MAKWKRDREIACLVSLQSLPGIGVATLDKLLDRFGSFTRVWSAAPRDLRAAGLGAEVTARLVQARARRSPDDFLRDLDRAGIKLVVKTESGYPASLKRLKTSPWVLFCQGEAGFEATMVAIVGSRHPTDYGRALAATLASELSGCGHTIVSGLAKGIDTAAHLAVIRAGGKTIAVLGGGLDTVASQQKRMKEQIVYSGGGVVSEHALGIFPTRSSFPARNRVIAGLCRGVVVVEAGRRSGAKSTARWAGKLGRPVMALPGLVTSDASVGCHDLIRGGATLVTCTRDILEEIEKAP
jgi:DNA processing protein